MELPNHNWEDPHTYQSLISTGEKSTNKQTLKEQLKGPSSPHVVAVFVSAMSEESWLKEHSNESLKGLKLIPKSNTAARCKLIKAIAAAGKQDLVSKEAGKLAKQACEEANWELAIELLPIVRSSPVYEQKTTVLHVLACLGGPEQVAKACQCLRQCGESIDVKDSAGQTPLQVAAFSGKTESIKQLLEQGAALEAKDNIGRTPLMHACLGKKPEVVQLFIDRKADIGVQDNVKQTPLMYACFVESHEIATSLISAGADIHTNSQHGETALHFAAKTEMLPLVKDLIQKGSDVNAKGLAGQTPLHIAAFSGKTEMAKQLLDQGAAIDAKDDYGRTPLTHACMNNKPEVAQLLIDKKADVGVQDTLLQTPLMYACAVGTRETAISLLSAGADIHTKNQEGDTPLHFAATRGMLPLVKELVQRGANVNALNQLGWSPLAQASLLNFDVVNALMDAGAVDDGLAAEFLERKLLAHRFGLAGKSLLSGKEITLEFFSSSTAVEHLQFVVKYYYAQLVSALTTTDDALWQNILDKLSPMAQAQLKVNPLEPEKIIKILGDTASAIAASVPKNASEVMDRLAKGLPVGIVAGWPGIGGPGHIVGMAVHGNRLARCNRGENCGDTPGILFETIGNPKNLEASLGKCVPETTREYFTRDISEELALDDRVYLSQQRQKVGNCAVANSNSMELALLYLQLEPLVGRNAAEELARAIKKGRTQDTRLGSVEDYLNWHKTPRKHPPDLALIGQLYTKNSSDPDMDRQVQKLIKEWADKSGTNLDDIVELGKQQNRGRM